MPRFWGWPHLGATAERVGNGISPLSAFWKQTGSGYSPPHPWSSRGLLRVGSLLCLFLVQSLICELKPFDCFLLYLSSTVSGHEWTSKPSMAMSQWKIPLGPHRETWDGKNSHFQAEMQVSVLTWPTVEPAADDSRSTRELTFCCNLSPHALRTWTLSWKSRKEEAHTDMQFLSPWWNGASNQRLNFEK